jgi:AcrR family transcriptional regulator
MDTKNGLVSGTGTTTAQNSNTASNANLSATLPANLPANSGASVTKPGSELAAKRREDILVTSAAIFAEKGYRNTDVQEIADRLGIGKGTIYRTFATKEDLFLACVDDGMERLNQWLICTMSSLDEQGELTQFERLERKILNFLTFFDNNPSLIELMIQERSEFKERATTSYYRHWQQNLPRWVKNIEAAKEQGNIRDIPAKDYLEVMSDVLYGAIFTSYFLNKQMNLKATAKTIADVMLYGLKGERKHQENREETKKSD